MERSEQILRLFHQDIRRALMMSEMDAERLMEIRLRAGAPLMVWYDNQEYFLCRNGKLSREKEDALIVSRIQLNETLEHVSSYSRYAFEEEIRRGYITVEGGHRVGLAGRTVLDGRGIKTIKYISCMNVRLSHQIKGCANLVLPKLFAGQEFGHTLIISPPRCGKTTLLRDIIRLLSDGNGNGRGMTVGVVDERSEIGACYQGIPQNDLGIRTDVLDGCPKADGMMMLVRAMSPDVVAVDEIGSREDTEAIFYAMNCGCKILATVHGGTLEEVRTKPVFTQLIEERWFERYVVMAPDRKPGYIEVILDGYGNKV